MKAHKKLMAALKAVEKEAKEIKLADWLETQPGSTWRGVSRGKFQLPKYVK